MMNAEQYLNYLIETSQQEFSFGIQPSELKTLKALFESEKKLAVYQRDSTFSVDRKGNPL